MTVETIEPDRTCVTGHYCVIALSLSLFLICIQLLFPSVVVVTLSLVIPLPQYSRVGRVTIPETLVDFHFHEVIEDPQDHLIPLTFHIVNGSLIIFGRRTIWDNEMAPSFGD